MKLLLDNSQPSGSGELSLSQSLFFIVVLSATISTKTVHVHPFASPAACELL